MILIIDNYDSFTYNIVQYAGEFCSGIVVKKNNEINLQEINSYIYSHIIISPGPGSPLDAGSSENIISKFYNKIPILGICLGHQVIGKKFGCKVVNAEYIMHGKVSSVEHNGQSKLFAGVPRHFNATRYHSLIIDNKINSKSLVLNSWLSDGAVMGVEHKNALLFGVQFHPESIETEFGKKIIENFLNIV